MSFSPIWATVGVPRELAAGQIHVWAWQLDSSPGLTGHAESHIALLDAKELERLHRFHFESDRARFCVAHANLRRILGAYLAQKPERVLIGANAFGKPELVGEALTHPLRFNLSHSKTTALLALSMDTEVGIDIEDLEPIEPEVAESHFSPSELAALSSLEGAAWLKGFYHCWTRKEAILKAEGVGLNLPLNSFDVSLTPGLPAKLLGVRPPVVFRHHWTLYNLETPAGTAAALAAGGVKAEVLCFRFGSDG